MAYEEERRDSFPLSVSDIEIEINDPGYEFIEIDKDDYEIVRIKCKDLNSVLTLQKSFNNGIIVDTEGIPIEPQPDFIINDYGIIEVLKDSPSIGLFKHKETGEVIRIMRCFTDAKVLRENKKPFGIYEYSLNSKRELIENPKVKDGHPLFWKFEDPRIKHGFMNSSSKYSLSNTETFQNLE